MGKAFKTKHQFESSVNSEGIETTLRYHIGNTVFESSVNSEGIETRDQR